MDDATTRISSGACCKTYGIKKKRILLIVCNRAGEIIRINENKNNLSFNLISHLGERGKIHLTLSETSPSAVMMTDQGPQVCLAGELQLTATWKRRQTRVRMGCSGLKTRELL